MLDWQVLDRVLRAGPDCTATLVPGDFLYVPARWWHMAICHQDALSLSIGVQTR